MSAARPPRPPDARKRPARGRVLVLAPHPDDETMGMAGTILLHREQDDPVTIVFVCSGIQGDPDGYLDRETIEDRRKDEARAAGAVLGVDDLHFWGYPDNLSEADFSKVFGDLPDDPDEQRAALVRGFATKVGAVIEEGGFDIVYYPWEDELNPDHWATGQAVKWLRHTRGDLDARVSFMGYDVWSPLIADTVIDISDVVERKLEAVRCYPTQLLYRDYVPALLGLDAYRSLFLERGATYGEGFRGRYKNGDPTEGGA